MMMAAATSYHDGGLTYQARSFSKYSVLVSALPFEMNDGQRQASLFFA